MSKIQSTRPSRVEAIGALLAARPDAFFVFSNGLTAREAAHFFSDARCFYCLHAMGEALAVGIGLARVRPGLDIVVVEGDGNALMGLAAWSMMPVPNLHYVVIDNGLFETTGSQPVPSLPVLPSWCTRIEIAPGKADTPNPPLPKQTWQICSDWLASRVGAT
jgi:thiamine pyrophosphate-dependent acetolactate synthase large subunit-like protein